MPPRLTGPYVGTSGFSYASWRPGFYPAGTPERDFLAHYATQLPSVEINSTFYNLPSEATVERWAETTPPEFRFAVKMNRRISHFGNRALATEFCERMKGLGESLGPIRVLVTRARDDGWLSLLPAFEQRVRRLGERLGPTRIPLDRPRDDGFLGLLLDSLDPELPYALDLRHPTWVGAEERVVERGVSVIDDLELPSPYRYVRLREPPYTDVELAAEAARLRPILERGEELYAYLRHEDEPTAPAYAARLLDLLRHE